MSLEQYAVALMNDCEDTIRDMADSHGIRQMRVLRALANFRMLESEYEQAVMDYYGI